MDLAAIRRLVIIAMFSDDVLMEKFVLKGGNALSLVYGIGARSSIDVDLSIPDDFTDLPMVSKRVSLALKDRFEAAGYFVFDEKFQERPSVPKPGRTKRIGGYQLEFKIIERETYDRLGGDLEQLRRNATLIGPEQKRRFKVDISKYEFCDAKAEVELDRYTIYVYSLPMLAIEKVRAICQQMPDYKLRSNPCARARDFYDIYCIVTERSIDLCEAENLELVRAIFDAKFVPFELLSRIKDTHDFHVVDWLAVQQSVPYKLEKFEFYFKFVVDLAARLQEAGIV
jgi:predicted nucleotidyltransferase component of viral defense system